MIVKIALKMPNVKMEKYLNVKIIIKNMDINV